MDLSCFVSDEDVPENITIGGRGPAGNSWRSEASCSLPRTPEQAIFHQMVSSSPTALPVHEPLKRWTKTLSCKSFFASSSGFIRLTFGSGDPQPSR
ncbi:hypothetical protein HPP92_028059, partial [Vanilla planifolia]